MTRDELIAKLRKFEWTDIEFKKAQRGVSNDTYRSVSAFANTAGGWLVFGVEENNKIFNIIGVLDVDKVQNDFLTVLRARKKLNRAINVQEDAIEHEDKTLLIFHVPESNRREKPVYLQGDIRKSFIRRGAGDEQCSQDEIERFLRDASERRHDAELIEDLTAENFFDPDSVTWYRRIYNEKNPGRHEHLTDIQFLNEWGFLVETRERLIPTRTGVLLFGQGKYVRQILPRAIVDYQRIDVDFEQWSPDKRWADRLVIEENLIQAWLSLVERYMRLAERPFSLEDATLRRHDVPPEYISFREAAINLLIHQDFGDHTRKPVIKLFRDQTVFWNPGDAYATTEQLLDPTEKDVRNPSVVAGFRRIGLSDQAGTGVRSIFANWQRLGRIPPIIQNDKGNKSFELVLHKEALLTEEQELFQSSLGVHLNENQAKVFAYACRNDGVLSIMDVKAVTSLNGPDCHTLLNQLVVQGLMETQEDAVRYQLATHLRNRFFPDADQSEPEEESTAQAGQESGSLSTGQAGQKPANLSTVQVADQPSDLSTMQVQPLKSLSERQWSVVDFCDTPRSMAEIVDHQGVSSKAYFRKKHLAPLIAGGVIRMTNPDNPQAPNQRYALTETGLRLKTRRMVKASKQEED